VVWLVSTRWSGGMHGIGKRIEPAHTGVIIDAIHSEILRDSKTKRDLVFGFDVPVSRPNVPSELLWPRDRADKAWSDSLAQ
jgi:phosphoenolpyruvate carboxykinase (ATP)